MIGNSILRNTNGNFIFEYLIKIVISSYTYEFTNRNMGNYKKFIPILIRTFIFHSCSYRIHFF